MAYKRWAKNKNMILIERNANGTRSVLGKLMWVSGEFSEALKVKEIFSSLNSELS